MKAASGCWRPAVLAAMLSGLVIGNVRSGAGVVVSEPEVLLRSVFRMRLVDQMPGQIQPLLGGLGTGDVTQVKAAYDRWSEGEMSGVRDELQARFGAAARERFEAFSTALDGAESRQDAGFLSHLAATVALNPPPRDYDELHSKFTSQKLGDTIHSASGFLSNLQTWLLLKQRIPNMPPLDAWLTRDQKPVAAEAAAAPVAPAPPPRRSAARQLAEAEPAMPEFKEEEGSTNDMLLAAFSASLKERREAIRQQAEKGMQTVTTERERAEQEVATRKQAEATAEAEAIKNQAQKIADAETQAIDQRANTWESKLKTVLSSTVSAASGAFFGGLGTQAGEKLSKSLFGKEDDKSGNDKSSDKSSK